MPDGIGQERRFLLSLKRTRAAAFRSEVFPYFRYVAQSGFGLLVSAALFTLIIGYANLLRDVPPDLPAGLAGAAAIALAAIGSPMRTYIQPADPVFLLPMENSVYRDYVRPALAASMRAGAIRTLAVFAVFVPLYIRAPMTEEAASGRPLWLLGITFAAMGAWNAYGGWRERQAAWAVPRGWLRSARYAATLLSVWGLLNGSPLPAWGLAIGLLTLVGLAWRWPRRQQVPWERLIKEEETTRRRWYRFLGWFVDVPSQESKPTRRRWAAWLPDRLPLDRGRAWLYVYGKTFIRGETFGAFVRWYTVMALVIAAADHPAADWIAYGAGIFIGGIQLTELGRLKLAGSVETLPLDRGKRNRAAAGIARAAGMAGAVLLWLFAAVPYVGSMGWIGPALLAAGLVWNAWIIPRRVAKPGDEDEEE
ncbi:ABC transporter permease [Cohnella sp. CFH 77786]|uniref:ABC transporter permease n=1 Tax=Cohnella sp. CFH 77786 TaxID=2662265 RepID=UPI001C60EDD1